MGWMYLRLQNWLFQLKEAGMPLPDGILGREELMKELLPLL